MMAFTGILLFALCAAACAEQKPLAARAQPIETGGTLAQSYPTKLGTLSVTEIATGFEFPWALVFLLDRRVLVTEKPGRLLLLGAEGTLLAEITGLPKLFVDGQAGSPPRRSGVSARCRPRINKPASSMTTCDGSADNNSQCRSRKVKWPQELSF